MESKRNNKKPRSKKKDAEDILSNLQDTLIDPSFSDEKQLDKIHERLQKYLNDKSFTDEQLLSFDIAKLKDITINKVNLIFDPIIKKREELIEQKKKNCKKEFKRMIKEQIPNYELKHCCVCKKSEVSVSLQIPTCNHCICGGCIENLQFLIEHTDIYTNVDHYTLMIGYKCPVCRTIHKKNIKFQEQYESDMLQVENEDRSFEMPRNNDYARTRTVPAVFGTFPIHLH